MTISSAGLLRNARQPRQAADRQERDVGRGDAVAARGERVAEFVQHDAGEDGDDEQRRRRAPRRRRRASIRRCAIQARRMQEGEVDADFASGNPRDGDRPGHARSPLRRSAGACRSGGIGQSAQSAERHGRGNASRGSAQGARPFVAMAGRSRRTAASTAAAGSGGLNRKPWTSVQPCSRTRSSCASVSTPSAVVDMPRLRPRPITALTMAQAVVRRRTGRARRTGRS